MLFYIVCFPILLFAQNYSKYYEQFSTYEFNQPESYVIQKFYESSGFADDGTIMIRRVENSIGDDAIHITMVNSVGVVMTSFIVFENEAGSFTPTCAAFNATTRQYCIAGINEENGSTSSPTKSWFLILDENLAYLDAKSFGVNITATTGGYQNLFVTDITAMEGISSNGLGDFLFTGVAGNALDPSPISGSEKEMYVGYVSYDATSSADILGPTRAFEFSLTTPVDFAVNNLFFPSRVIEIPLSSGTAGFIITGTARKGTIFFTRIDYHLANVGATSFYTPGTGNFYAGDLYFDAVEDEVWFAGSFMDESDKRMIYQKIVDLTTTNGVTMYSNTTGTFLVGNNRFGTMSLYNQTGPIKISKIMRGNSANEAIIAANFYESSYYSSPNNYTFPSLHKILYDDQALDDFTNLGQYPDLYTYPRYVGNIGLGNYLPYLDHYNLYYPAHTAHSLPYADGRYILGATTFDKDAASPERIALNRTENYFDNDCNYIGEYLDALSISSTFTSITPASTTDIVGSGTTLSWTMDAPVDLNDCIDDAVFKSDNQNSNSSVFTNKLKLNIFTTSSTLTIKTNMQEGNYIIYNSIGAVVYKGKINEGYGTNSLSDFVDGMYLVEVCDQQNKRIVVKKISK